MAHRTLTVLALVVSWLGLHAQDPVPTPTPPPPAPTPTPAPEPAPSTAPAETPPPNGERGAGRRRGGPGERQNQDLPEFTPVAAPSPQGLLGKQYFWFTMYPNFVVQYDPATDTVAKKVELTKGLFWNTTLTHDRKRLLVTTNQQSTIEVVDLATGTVTGVHDFTEEGIVLRIRDVRELPGGVHWHVRVERVKKQIDRYSFEPNQWLLYDSAEKKVTKRVPKLPKAFDRNVQLAPAGTHWISQDDDGNLVLLDARKLTEIGKIDLRTPRFFGAGAIRLTGQDLLDNRDPQRGRYLFNSTDPVEKNRTTWGVVEVDLEQKRIVDVQEWGPSVSSWGLRVAHKKLIAAGMSGNFGGGNDRDNKTRLFLYDLRNGQKIVETSEELRPRRSLVAISPDADKIYIGTAGSDFEIFDAQLKRLKTVELEGEIVGRIFVVDG